MPRWAPASLVALLLVAAPLRGVAQETSVWTPGAVAAHERASLDYARWVRARHDPERLGSQRTCFDEIASRAGALIRMLEDRAELGRIPPWSVRDMEHQLDALEVHAAERCTRTGVQEGPAEVDVWRDPFLQRMSRERALLRIGGRFEMAPRVRRGGYAPVPLFGLQGALGGFVLPWLRAEATATFGWHPSYGPHGSIGARLLLTAPWSLFRIAGGVAASVVLAADRVGNIEFGWLGVTVEIPFEIAWEISESFGLALTGGPIYTQAGEVRLDPRALGFSAGLLCDFVL